MDYLTLVDSMTPELYRRFQRAVETGRWPDGSRVQPQQREAALQAMITWGERHLPPEERVGHLERGAGSCAKDDGDLARPLAWRDTPAGP